MIAILKSLIYLASLNHPVSHITICNKDLSHLNYKKQIEISIGCSKVDGIRYYSDHTLKELYEQL
jgi:hypothetical protein